MNRVKAENDFSQRTKITKGSDCGTEVRILTFNADNLSLNPAEDNNL